MEQDRVQPSASTVAAPATGTLKSHRGGVVLTLGILGLVVCFICGIIAWVMGNKDLQEMEQGLMDPAGKGLTQAGRICGIVSVVLAILGTLVFIIVALASAAA
jgi:hypothetical protein